MNDANIVQFMNITNCSDIAQAKYFIEAAGGDLGTAVNLFFRNPTRTTSTQQPQTTPQAPPHRNNQNTSLDDDVRSPIPQTVQNLMFDNTVYGPYHNHSGFPKGLVPRRHVEVKNDPAKKNLHNSNNNENSEGNGNGNGNENGGESIFNKLLKKFVNPFAGMRKKSNKPKKPKKGKEKITDGKAFSKLFEKPKEIMFYGSFEDAKDESMKKKKWLLVFVHNETEFESMQMLRDTFKNDVLKELIRMTFVFFLVDSKSPKGRNFKALYNTEQNFVYPEPFLCVIDPRTGEEMKRWTGFQSPKDLQYNLEHFDHKNIYEEIMDFDLPKEPKKEEIINDKMDIDGSDEELEKAIFESLKEENLKSMIHSSPKKEEKKILSEFEKNPNEIEKKQLKDIQEALEEPIPMPSLEKNIDDEIDSKKWICRKKIEGATCIRLNYPNGKKEIINILKSAPTACIYSIFREKLSVDDRNKTFKIVFFNREIENSLKKTIKEDKLENSSLSIQF